MKTARLLFAIIVFGALTLEVGYAEEPSRTSAGRDFRKTYTTSVYPADRTNDKGHQTDRQHSPLNNAGHATEKSSQPGPLHIQPKHTSSNELHQPELNKGAITAKDGLMLNKTGAMHEQPARLTVGNGATTSLPGVVRDRNATLAPIGGLAASSAKNSTAALNGTAFKRKP